MRVKVSELRRVLRNAVHEMKLGLDSGARGAFGLGAGPSASGLGDPDDEVASFQRDTDADDYDEMMLGRKFDPPTAMTRARIRR